jgi:hypothetical protein
MPEKSTSELVLGFLGLYPTTSQDGFLGALLVTDAQGLPQEFRCTHPIKPTAVQKPLYGDTLEPHIGVNLCGTRLLESAQKKPSLIIVNREYLTGIRTAAHCPVVFVQKAGEAIEVRMGGSGQPSPGRMRIESPGGRFQPIVIVPHPQHKKDADTAGEMLEKVLVYLDPTEPFERMRQAIDMLVKADSRFR